MKTPKEISSKPENGSTRPLNSPSNLDDIRSKLEVASQPQSWEEEFEAEFIELSSDWTESARKTIPAKNLELQTATNEGWNNARKVAKLVFKNLLLSNKAKLREEIEGKYRKTDDPFETFKEIRQEEIEQGQWSTADTKAGYNQAIKDILNILR